MPGGGGHGAVPGGPGAGAGGPGQTAGGTGPTRQMAIRPAGEVAGMAGQGCGTGHSRFTPAPAGATMRHGSTVGGAGGTGPIRQMTIRLGGEAGWIFGQGCGTGGTGHPRSAPVPTGAAMRHGSTVGGARGAVSTGPLGNTG